LIEKLAEFAISLDSRVSGEDSSHEEMPLNFVQPQVDKIH